MVSRTSKSKHTCLFLILAVKNSPWKMLLLVDFMQTPFRIRRTSPSCLTSFFITLYKKVRNAYWISVILSYILRWSFFVFFSNWSLAHRFLNDKTNLPSYTILIQFSRCVFRISNPMFMRNMGLQFSVLVLSLILSNSSTSLFQSYMTVYTVIFTCFYFTYIINFTIQSCKFCLTHQLFLKIFKQETYRFIKELIWCSPLLC